MNEEVREATYSDDLSRMLRALDQPLDPISRHFLFQHIVERAYKLRHENQGMRELCEQIARRHLGEFEPMATAFKGSFGGTVPAVPSFRCLATVLVEKGSYNEAVKVCETALRFGAYDGTASGFQGRAVRIRNQQQAIAEGHAKPASRRKPRPRAPEDIRSEQSNVPRMKQYFATIDDMDADQRGFFNRWCRAWDCETPLPVDGNISYLFCYTYSVLADGPSKAIRELNKLIQAYRALEPSFADYCRKWLSDCHVALKKYREAFDSLPQLHIGSRSAGGTDSVLSLKLQVGERISGRDILTLNGPHVTAWGRQHVDALSGYLTILIEAFEREHQVNLIKQWAQNAYSYPYFVFGGTVYSRESTLKAYSFSTHEPACNLVQSLTRQAEITLREEIGLPRVGEGWISETNLFYEIKRSMPTHEIVQHARPQWLGKQHLDIFIPSLAVAIEFQGAQHDQPVEYFGGRSAFEANQRRDKMKAKRCIQNKIRLIYVRPNYCLNDVLDEISLVSNEK